MEIDGKLILVTGASSGIGAATSRALANEGGRVVLLARTESSLATVAEDIAVRGGRAWAYPVDLTDAAAVDRAAAHIRSVIGAPDIVVNNAGAGRWLFVEETTPDQAVQMMAAPYFAAFFITRAFIPEMLARNQGHIVNLTSPAAILPWPGALTYGAARWAMRGFSKGLAADLYQTGIGVTLIVAGHTKSTYWEHNPGSEERLPAIGRFIPSLTPEQVAAAVIKGIRQEKAEVIVPLNLKLFVTLHRFFPRLVERLVWSSGWRRKRG